MFNHALMGSLMRKAVEPEPTYALILNHEEDYAHNDNVPIWNDKTGNDAHAVQATASRQPSWSTTQFNAGSVQGASNKGLIIPANAHINDIFAGSGGGVAFVAKIDAAGGGSYGRILDKHPATDEKCGFRVTVDFQNAYNCTFIYVFSLIGATVANRRVALRHPNLSTYGNRILHIWNFKADPQDWESEVYFFGQGTVNGKTTSQILHTPVSGASYTEDDEDLGVLNGNTVTTAFCAGAVPFVKFKKGSFFTLAEIEGLKILAKNTYQVNIPD